ncbi:MAG: phosphate-starvation-inducible PsiE family protein [Candidatus Dormibacteraeota bacterium]|uniref:Phosphate-starvation-inducible PsiE family protein n=1 Tax=Candidatus Aeolococcus gillhamiae TaxID=3127015 RepID=A0A934K2Z9_9BACT|nr:phosphate-starvation-inducible PsiE family protein [Candidatus Dormibacteraeota bacterium]
MNPHGARRRNGRALAGLEMIEDAIYAVIAVFLIGSGVLLLLGAGIDISKTFDINNIHPLVVRVLDETLLVFMVVELLHTVRVTLRDHTLAAEPFLIVGLIAGVRRILILTASSDTLHSGPDFVVYWVQLLLLIVLVVAMVIALFIWRRTASGDTPADR